MGKLIYSMITSLDGFTADAHGDFGWAEPDAESHVLVNEQSRSLGTHLYGRRMYETMLFWETALDLPDVPPHIADYARIWQAADKVVYSTTLADVSSARTRLVRTFDAEEVRALKADAELDLAVNGPHLAAQAVRAGLVDEYQPYVVPVVVGTGTRFYPADVALDLELLELERSGGLLWLRYADRSAR